MSLTVGKQLLTARTGWGRTPLARLVMRDGTLSFIVVFGAHRFVAIQTTLMTLYCKVLLFLTIMHVAFQNNAAFVIL